MTFPPSSAKVAAEGEASNLEAAQREAEAAVVVL
jgi:hypothetical protein